MFTVNNPHKDTIVCEHTLISLDAHDLINEMNKCTHHPTDTAIGETIISVFDYVKIMTPPKHTDIDWNTHIKICIKTVLCMRFDYGQYKTFIHTTALATWLLIKQIKPDIFITMDVYDIRFNYPVIYLTLTPRRRYKWLN